MRRLAPIVFVSLIAAAVLPQGTAHAQASPPSKSAKTDQEKERTKSILLLKQRVQRYMEARQQLKGRCGRCEGDGFIVKGFSGGLPKAAERCDRCLNGHVWSEKNVAKVTRDFYSAAGASSDVARAAREEFTPEKFTLENFKRLVPDSWSFARRNDEVVLFGDSHAHVYLVENGVAVDQPSAWVRSVDGTGKPLWCLWTEKDAPWPAEDQQGTDTAAVDQDEGKVPGGDGREPAPAAEEKAEGGDAESAARGVPVLAKRLPAADLMFDPQASAGLFVGVRTFIDAVSAEETSVQEVPYGVDDAIDLAHAFSIEFGLIAAKNIHMCLGGDPQKPLSRERLKELVDAGATVAPAGFTAVRAKVKEVSRVVARDAGMLVMSFATHGFRTDDGDDLLMASDSAYGDKAEALSVRFIMDQTSMSPSRRRILLFDACRERQVATRGGSVAGNSLSESFAREVGRHEGTFALFAAAVGGFSYDNRKLRNGVFSGAFIAGMRGGATPDERNMITLAAIADFVNRQVREWRVQLEGSAPMLDDIERHSGTSFDLMPLTLYHPATPDEGGEAR